MKIGVIFDMDGTLLDTLDDLTDAVNVALGEYGYPSRTREQVRCALGNGAAHLIGQSVPEGADPEPVGKHFHAYYAANCRHKTKPFAGIPEALDALGGTYPLAVVSNKPDLAVKAISAQLFPGVYGLGETPELPRKPAPDMLYLAMEAIGVETCIYVGDSDVDVFLARNAGVPSIAVAWGYRSRQELIEAGADYFCQSPKDLPALIQKIVATLDAAEKM